MNRIITLRAALKQLKLIKSTSNLLNLTAKDLEDLISFDDTNQRLVLHCKEGSRTEYCDGLASLIRRKTNEMSDEAKVACDAIQMKGLNLRYMTREWLILSHNFASIIPELGITHEIFKAWVMEDVLPEIESVVDSPEKYLNIFNDGFQIDDYNPDQEDGETITQNRLYFDMMKDKILMDLDAGGSIGLPFSKVQQLLLSTTNLSQERALSAKLLSRILA